MSVTAYGGGVTAVPEASELDKELRAVYEGGDNYVARVQLLEKRKQAARKILEEFDLAVSAKEWRDEAAKLRDAAKKANAEAQQALSDAKLQAKETLSEAKEIYALRQREAAEILQKAQADAESALKAASDEAATIKAEAEASSRELLAAAKADRERAIKLLADAQARERESVVGAAKLAKERGEIEERASKIKAAQAAVAAALGT